ncbi:MAG: hypothetical protein KAT16_01420 [Candidatus Heimdallarchaeota archaeon]|nr:hypothetical protein [Candidatus Heimdallarchaeota archaeon]
MSFKDTAKAKRLIILLLQDMESATTEELITEAETLGIAECRDRVPSSIADLYSEGLLTRELSKEKKAIVWSLAEDIDVEELTKEKD